MADQVLKTRAVAVGGVLKRYLREHADLTSEPGEEEAAKEAERLFFGWKQEVKRYRRLSHNGSHRYVTKETAATKAT